MTDDDLLRHYLGKGAPEAAEWNLSAECAYVDYRLRTWARELVEQRSGQSVLNVGIGVGEWDDALGYLLRGHGGLTSIDIDPAICATLEARQRREGHPNPARVLRADVLNWQPEERFDLVTMIGSTISETGDSAAAVDAGLGLLAPKGRLALVTIGEDASAGPARRKDASVRVVGTETDHSIGAPIRLVVLEAQR